MNLLFETGYVERSQLEFVEVTAADGSLVKVLLNGLVTCEPPVLVEVTKWMDVRNGPTGVEVISTYYRYHAWQNEPGHRTILRYDCAHGHSHCHRYDRFGNQQEFDVELEDVPRLDDFIYEAVDISRSWTAAEEDSGEPAS